MDTDSVDKMLASYTKCKARVIHIRNQLAIMQHQLEYAQSRAMQEEALHGQSYDTMPHGNLPGNPVESLVLRYISGYQPKYIREMQQDVDRARDELYEAEMVIRFVDGWLLCLNERERYVIERQVIAGASWREVLDGYEQQFGQFGKEGLKKIKKRALEKIYEAAA